MTVTDDLVRNNEQYATTSSGALPSPPSRQIAIVTCMDARLDAYRMLGLGEGEAHVISNAAAGRLAEETGQQPRWRAHAFANVDEDVRHQVATVQDNPFLPHTDQVRGFVFDVETGALREVV